MCGIAGLVGFDAPLARVERLVGEMCQRMYHRGPDGGGTAAHIDATLGMKRLAIVDVEHGDQPMATDDGSLVIVYNGEVYNAPALRKQLASQGVGFRTRSDTEVVLRLYERDPESVEKHLVGMWAFAIHDRRRRRIVLSRDRFGIKPLFIASRGSRHAFASELRCFDRSLPELQGCFALDHGAAHAMLTWGYIPEAYTIYEGVERVPPGTRVVLDLTTGERTTQPYWRIQPSEDASRVRTLSEACELVETLLRRAVAEHLESDVPVATFLSGGIDSSLVTYYAYASSRRPIKAYSIGFVEQRFDESPFARAAAERIGIPIQVSILDETTARSSLADAILAYDEPFGDSSSLATYLLARHVAKDYKVALGGDGGDEVFAGYKKHRIVTLRAPFERAPRIREGIARALATVPTRTDRSRGWTELLRTVRRLARGLHGSDAQAYLALTQVASLAHTAPLVRVGADADKFEHHAIRRFMEADGTTLQRTLMCDLAGPLPNDMLVKVDRATMAHHVEARVPFLDHRVVEAGLGLPEEWTLGRNGKRVLRTLHERVFGAKLARRKKQGFGVPVERWLRTSLDSACSRLFDRKRLDRTGVLSSDALSESRFREWASSDPQILWHAFALATWLEANHGDGPDTVREMFR